MVNPLKPEIPSQGWRQILTARREILDMYDRARDQARSHEVETLHGKVAEAACRKWLGDFLPKRFGVTSGYVISPGLPSSQRAPHFDVIIYDQLESPVLWVEDNPDSSAQGRSLAVPVEHVRAVLEVKSALATNTVRQAIEHLDDLRPLMQAVDSTNDRYKLHLPMSFYCGLVFIELRQTDANSTAALAEMINGIRLRGFAGGIVLRGEGHTQPHAGRLMLTQSEESSQGNFQSADAALLEFGMSSTICVAEKVHIGARLSWAEMAFAQFAFDLVALLQGTYEVGRLSSFYGVGSSWAELMRDVGAKRGPT